MTYSHDAVGGEEMYRENVLEHARHPSNKGTLPDATFSHREVNAACGDTIDMFVRLKDGRIDAVRWEGTGCAISQACASMVSESLEGVETARLAGMGLSDVEALLGFPVVHTRLRCALLGLRTAQAGLAEHEGRAE